MSNRNLKLSKIIILSVIFMLTALISWLPSVAIAIPGPTDVYVDITYYDADHDGDHEWGVDAFNSIQAGIDAVGENGTVHVAAGTYESSRKIIIETNGVHLVGPGITDGISRAIIRNTNCTKHTISILATDVRIEGLQLEQKSGGVYCLRIGQPVVRLNAPAVNTEIVNNDIAGGENGILFPYDTSAGLASGNVIHDNAHGIAVNSPNTHIVNNDIYDSSGTDVSVGYGIWFRCLGIFCDSSGSVVEDNDIHNNGYGIYYQAGDQGASVIIGHNNDIHDNDDGVYVNGNAHNLRINGNHIYDNISSRSGLHVESSENGLDATENWWGDDSGPTIDTNPDGTGDEISINNTQNGAFIRYRPFCTNESCSTNSAFTVSAEDIISLFGDGGTIIVPEGEDYNNVTQLEVNEEANITLQAGGGTTTITLPAGTVITKTGGGTFDANDLTASEVTLGSLSGFAAGETPLGAMQWGLPDMGLSFNPAITINLYVGTALSGQTLIIRRLPPEGGDWTTDGIVDPGTCIVSAEGICSFQTTKASDFVALDEEDESEKAHIDSWKAFQYENPNVKCIQRLKLEIKGKHFDKNAEVRIGNKEASSVNRKSSKEITAKFCLEELLNIKTNFKRTISVTNPDADKEKADKEIDLDNLFSINSSGFDQSTPEGVKNIQKALVKLGYLDSQYVTGNYGPLTTEAVKKFQADNGLPQTGFVGPLTRAKLLEM